MNRIAEYSVELVRERTLNVESKNADCPENVATIARQYLGNPDREYFVAFLLNSRNQVIGINTVSVGTLSSSLVHPREVFKPAILAGAAAIIVVHNHPSEDVSPSPEDKTATRRLKESGELLGIPLLDHVIIGAGHFSFRCNGLLG